MPRPFVPPGTPSQYLPDRPVSAEHVRLEITLDLPGRRLQGRATHRLRVRRDGVKAVELHAVAMTIDAVSLDGQALSFHYDGQLLRAELGQSYARGAELTLSVDYRCAPRRGLFFVGPDERDPNRPLGCWTQGQDEDSRHYWPGLDIPIEKASSEVICTAPRGLFVLSNGELREKTDVDKNATRWHYVLDFPHSAYLVTLVCGPFVEQADRAPETGVEVRYYLPPGREADGPRTFGRTPQMIDFFSKQIGVPYPHARYSQIAVPEFIFGGMENTSATTLTDQALIDQRAALDHDVDGLVAHELAHQWWGDLLTCREWPEAWLNEGFATYFEYIWREHAHGRDEADAELLVDTDAYLGEAGRYQRPIVCRQYEEPIELFDSHLYEKGGRVLHMLRHLLGDETFWRALKRYAEGHARQSVETRDLMRALEEASGRTLEQFFAQWIGRPGHPEIEGSWRWDEERKVGTLHLEQKQDGDEPFAFDTELEVEVEGKRQRQPLVVRLRTHDFEISLPARPTQVIVDPGDVVLKTIAIDKPGPLWNRQLAAAALAVDRIHAARTLGERPSPESEAALRTALETDRFWAVRAAAARALGQIRGDGARDALLAARKQPHPKVRRSVAAALGEFRDDPVAAEALASWAEAGDPSYFVEANAALALGRTRGATAVRVLTGMLTRDSFQDVIRARALEGMGNSGDETALDHLVAAFTPKSSFQARRAALAGVAKLAEGTTHARQARELFERALDDRDFRVRMEAASGLVAIGDGKAIPALERAMRAELDGRTKRRLRQAIAEIGEGGGPAEQTRKLGDELERVRKELRDLRSRLDKLESTPPATPPRGSPMRRREGAAVTRRPRPPARRGTKPRRRSR